MVFVSSFIVLVFAFAFLCRVPSPKWPYYMLLWSERMYILFLLIVLWTHLSFNWPKMNNVRTETKNSNRYRLRTMKTAHECTPTESKWTVIITNKNENYTEWLDIRLHLTAAIRILLLQRLLFTKISTEMSISESLECDAKSWLTHNTKYIEFMYTARLYILIQCSNVRGSQDCRR